MKGFAQELVDEARRPGAAVISPSLDRGMTVNRLLESDSWTTRFTRPAG